MEGLFKFLLFLAIFLFCLIVVGVFIIILKIILMFQPEINLLGLMIY